MIAPFVLTFFLTALIYRVIRKFDFDGLGFFAITSGFAFWYWIPATSRWFAHAPQGSLYLILFVGLFILSMHTMLLVRLPPRRAGLTRT